MRHSVEVQTVCLLETQFSWSAAEGQDLLVLAGNVQRQSTTSAGGESMCLATLMNVS